MKGSMKLIGVAAVVFGWCNQGYTFSRCTHKALTEKATYESILDDYLKFSLGMRQGLNTKLLLDQSTVPVGEVIPREQFECRIRIPEQGLRDTVINLLRRGSYLEDVNIPRARHHFHAPVDNRGVSNANAGLDNLTDHPGWWGPGFSLRAQAAIPR